MDPRTVTLFWAGLATLLAAAGWFIAARFSPNVASVGSPNWDAWTEVPLFAGLGLLGFGLVGRDWARKLVLAGWLLFAFYWALVAQDLYILEGGDIVNMVFALVGVYFFTYLAYHQWLNHVRGAENGTVRFLNIGTFVAAGSYFVIDKIQVVRTWLILAVSGQTRDMLTWFGQGASKGLVYLTDLRNVENPTYFFYTGTFCDPNHTDPAVGRSVVADWCRDHGLYKLTSPEGHGFWGGLLHFNPLGDDPTVIPVSVILACTALQSIMLFVGLFMATRATWKKRLVASVVVAAVVYVLNLVRNTGIIWFYGQGDMSFWTIHDAIGKGGSLIAMVGIAFACFRWFPEFLSELIGVLDLPHRDGPVERTLRIGRRRPDAPPPGPPS